ncbi:MAG: hypothetical protein JRM85_08905 [Nitrososphaerota archaeon]|nr:hypothetical protein [Nitrososphaerota archaeon]
MRALSRAAALGLLGLLIFGSLAGAVGASAQSTDWVSSFSIKDLTGNQVLQPSAPLVAGHTYNATVDIAVPVGAAGATFNVTLNQAVSANGSQFWYLLTPSYAGYDRATFTSSLREVSFNWVEGSLVLSALFEVPINLTTTTTDGLTLHLAKQAFPLVVISTTEGSVGTVGVSVVDQSIQAYLSDYQAASALITSGQVSQAYSSLLKDELAQAQSMYQEGLTVQAAALLESLTPSNLPSPPSDAYVSYVIAAALVLAVLAVSLGILWARGRGRSGFATGLIDEANRELASLEVVAGRYDRNLADQLKTLRDKLSEAA